MSQSNDLVGLGARLKFCRVKSKMTQQEVADQTNYTKDSISKFELGKRKPPEAAIVKMAELCNVDLEWLRSGDEKRKPVTIDPQDKAIDLALHQLDMFCQKECDGYMIRCFECKFIEGARQTLCFARTLKVSGESAGNKKSSDARTSERALAGAVS